ncbi:MAG: cation diffusion facilitator family transporter [Clostridia bacterium]
MNWIKKLLIKNYKNVYDKKVRNRYGIMAGIIGIISNVLLFVAKFVVGLLSNSLTIIADAINNLSDAGSSAITTVGFKMSAKPADSEHPFGHERYEQITGLIVAIAVFAIGVMLAKSSIEKIIEGGNAVVVNVYTYIVLGIAILGKIFQMLIYRSFGKAISSNALMASSADSRNDIVSTAATLIAIIIIQFVHTKISIDGIFGLAVSLFIIISSIGLIKETISPLLGEKPPKELVNKITSKLQSYDGVLGIHDLMIHNYGISNTFVLVHIEVDANVNVMISHELIDNIEQDFIETMGMHLSVHMDPIQIDNDEVNRLKAICEKLLAEYDCDLSMHDFRIVPGESHTNILFDVVLPFDSKKNKANLQALFEDNVKGENIKYNFIIGIDRPYM